MPLSTGLIIRNKLLYKSNLQSLLFLFFMFCWTPFKILVLKSLKGILKHLVCRNKNNNHILTTGSFYFSYKKLHRCTSVCCYYSIEKCIFQRLSNFLTPISYRNGIRFRLKKVVDISVRIRFLLMFTKAVIVDNIRLWVISQNFFCNCWKSLNE